MVLTARSQFPRPRDFDLSPPALQPAGLQRAYWLYVDAVAVIGAGYADFALIAFGRAAVVSTLSLFLPCYFSGTGATSNVVLGAARAGRC